MLQLRCCEVLRFGSLNEDLVVYVPCCLVVEAGFALACQGACVNYKQNRDRGEPLMKADVKGTDGSASSSHAMKIFLSGLKLRIVSANSRGNQ